ncbi:unnamed protein product [Phytomonas sp. Hart1]|nr:unnamed protein product [Phytomonas sp. Hart1]|eukprot:CCW67404.1 unnamed protein product [Phytomonas sp. isolate Hart1]
MLRSSFIRRFNVPGSKTAIQVLGNTAGHHVPKRPELKIRYYTEMAYEGLRHVYHGFRLLFINIRLAWKYHRQLKKGLALTRRERILLEDSTKDLLRLVPFSFFIVVPFAELLLPVALKMFPGLIPSTFETESQGRNRGFRDSMKTLRARQRVMDYVSSTALTTFNPEEQEVIRRSALGDTVTLKDIRLIGHYFDRDGPFSVYKVPDHIAMGLGRICNVFKWYHSLFPAALVAPLIRRRVIRHYQRIREDDRMLRLEGLDLLNMEELIKANKTRGMRWTETKDTLLVQLEWWVAVAYDPNVPFNTLFWIKPTRYNLRKSMNSLPVEQRRQLLGIQNLPESFRSSLEAICATVDTVTKIEGERESADKIVQRIVEIMDSANQTGIDMSLKDIQAAVGAYLTEENIVTMFVKLKEHKLEEELVLVSDVIEWVGHETHNSSHVVSTLFDAFDYGAGSKPITQEVLVGIGARCREATQKNQLPRPLKDKSAKE